jgi:hypothetical protein
VSDLKYPSDIQVELVVPVISKWMNFEEDFSKNSFKKKNTVP